MDYGFGREIQQSVTKLQIESLNDWIHRARTRRFTISKQPDSGLRCNPLFVVPITLRDASKFVELNHRHHKPPQGGLFAVACAEDGANELCGVAIVGKPVARMANDGWTVEVTRLCTLGQRNACSILYRAAWRAARAMGYRKLITYTLPEEGGASLRASGFRLIGEAGGGSWDRNTRPRVDRHPTQVKFKWEIEDGKA